VVRVAGGLKLINVIKVMEVPLHSLSELDSVG